MQGLRLAKKKSHHLAVGRLAIAFLLVAGAAQFYYIPWIDSVKSAKPAAEKIKTMLNMDYYKIAAIEPIGSKRFVLLKKVTGAKGEAYEITHRR